MIRALELSKLSILGLLLVLIAPLAAAAGAPEPAGEALAAELVAPACEAGGGPLAAPAFAGDPEPVWLTDQCACLPICHDRATGCTAQCNISTNCQCAYWVCP